MADFVADVSDDLRANLGSSLRTPLETRIPITHMLIPTIEDPTMRVKDPNDHVETTNFATVEDPGMTLPYQDLTSRIRLQRQDPGSNPLWNTSIMA